MTALTLTAVNVGTAQALRIGARDTVSGIDKRPVPGRVALTRAGLSGDQVLNRRHHGGRDQAAYLYTAPDYAHWAALMPQPPTPGLFGENLTLSGLESAQLRVGDRFTVHGPGGDALLEVTAPRVPCATLAAHVHDTSFARQFARERRPGAYLRVLGGGTVGAGDPVTFTPGPDDAPTLGELLDLALGAAADRATLEAYLAFPVAVRVRRDLERRLARLPLP